MVVLLLGLAAAAPSIPVAVPDDVRVAAAQEARARVEDAQVTAVHGFWRPGSLAVDVEMRRAGGVAVVHFLYRDGELSFVDQTVGSGRGALPYVGIIAAAAALVWLLAQVAQSLLAPKCPHHRWVPLRVERQRLFSGGNDEDGMPLEPIDLVIATCPRGDYTRRRVVAVPAAGITEDPGDFLDWSFWADRAARRHAFRGHTTDAGWREMFQRFKEQYEGEEWRPL
ncbi:MAG: hypothetical protein IMW98_04830 [Firmicutes bacterium]|nr:hypothetical protein [Bacillota bacterium]